MNSARLKPRVITSTIASTIILALVLIGLTQFGSSLATVINALTLEQQVEKAQIIMHTLITNSEVQNRANNKTWTAYALDPKKFIRGSSAELIKTNIANKQVLSLSIYGGANIKLEGAPSFKAGDELVVLMYTKAYDNPIVGFNQGVYRVTGGKVTTLEGKPLTVTLEGKPVEATLENFLKQLEALAVGK
jgi:hypothetical protein